MNCDWCGEPFAEGEKPVEGFDGQPTHRKKCQYEALRWERKQRGFDDAPYEREPFTDWPNGQGTYD